MEAKTPSQALITVMRYGEDKSHDLEIPTYIPSAQLVVMVSAALKWDVDPWRQPLTYRIEAQPSARVVEPHETLAQAGVWDGAILVFYPLRAAAFAPLTMPAVSGRVAPTPPPVATGGPVRGWRPLGRDPATPPRQVDEQ